MTLLSTALVPGYELTHSYGLLPWPRDHGVLLQLPVCRRVRVLPTRALPLSPARWSWLLSHKSTVYSRAAGLMGPDRPADQRFLHDMKPGEIAIQDNGMADCKLYKLLSAYYVPFESVSADIARRLNRRVCQEDC